MERLQQRLHRVDCQKGQSQGTQSPETPAANQRTLANLWGSRTCPCWSRSRRVKGAGDACVLWRQGRERNL